MPPRPRTLIWLLLLTACAYSPDPVQEDAETILRRVTTTLTDPTMEGRGAGQIGGERAARWLASQFAAAGLLPLPTQPDFLLELPVSGYTVLPTSTVRVAGEPLEYGRDFLFSPFEMAWRPVARELRVGGPLVFVGRGHDGSGRGGPDVRGAIVVMIDPVDANGPIGDWAAVDDAGVVADLVRRGAVAVVRIGPDELTGTVAHYGTLRSAAFDSVPDGLPAEPIPVVVVRESIALAWLERADVELAAGSMGDGKAIALHAEAEIVLRTEGDRGGSAPAYNVAGYLPGSGEAQEAVFVSAHYDAYGVQRDTVYPGAADNALGVAKLLAVANTLARDPDRLARPVVFLAPTAHEASWMLGSTHFLRSGAWPVDRIAAAINIDGIGSEVWGPPNMVHAMGFEQTDMQALLQREVDGLGLRLEADVFTGSRIFQRSDGFQFARCGVPSIYLVAYPGSWEEIGDRLNLVLSEHVHYAADTIRSDWYWEGAATNVELLLNLVRALASAATLPSWIEGMPLDNPRHCPDLKAAPG